MPRRTRCFTLHNCHFAPITPCLPFKSLHRHCSQFFLGITVVSRKIEESAYLQKLGGKQGVLWAL